MSWKEQSDWDGRRTHKHRRDSGVSANRNRSRERESGRRKEREGHDTLQSSHADVSDCRDDEGLFEVDEGRTGQIGGDARCWILSPNRTLWTRLENDGLGWVHTSSSLDPVSTRCIAWRCGDGTTESIVLVDWGDSWVERGHVGGEHGETNTNGRKCVCGKEKRKEGRETDTAESEDNTPK
ncbi:hypothetical protein BLNAU_16496 [Blattamonas nauphoetae]|uniref:Uncharacterized protein n=1 Tax=Blattamonas nauphoetae TaxID=2049346 RepID=A0ABQ9XD66_9EUKA|nr:hypothetical protein BLNAU_16496 [Blattamonas nauphoetae]